MFLFVSNANQVIPFLPQLFLPGINPSFDWCIRREGKPWEKPGGENPASQDAIVRN